MCFTGTKGRIELHVLERSYFNGKGDKSIEGGTKFTEIMVYPMFAEPYKAEFEIKEGGHGGGDPILLNGLFGVPVHDPLNRAASHVDGVASIMTGICANKSIAREMPVKIEEVLGRKFKDLK